MCYFLQISIDQNFLLSFNVTTAFYGIACGFLQEATKIPPRKVILSPSERYHPSRTELCWDAARAEMQCASSPTLFPAQLAMYIKTHGDRPSAAPAVDDTAVSVWCASWTSSFEMNDFIPDSCLVSIVIAGGHSSLPTVKRSIMDSVLPVHVRLQRHMPGLFNFYMHVYKHTWTCILVAVRNPDTMEKELSMVQSHTQVAYEAQWFSTSARGVEPCGVPGKGAWHNRQNAGGLGSMSHLNFWLAEGLTKPLLVSNLAAKTFLKHTSPRSHLAACCLASWMWQTHSFRTGELERSPCHISEHQT